MRIFSKVFIFITLVICISLPSTIWATSTGELNANLHKPDHPSIVMVVTFFSNHTHGQSTGFFINKLGDVATAYHSVFNASKIKIITKTQETFQVIRVKKTDQLGDIAILSVDIPPEKITPVKLDQSLPKKGDSVHIIGHPMGHTQSETNGLVSSLYEIINFGRLIQFSAPMATGSSGSPLFNDNGEVIGLASFMFFRGNSGPPMNFAYPSRRIINLQ